MNKTKFVGIKGRDLDHIGLAVCDVEAAKDWYTATLGFTVIGTFDCGIGHNVYFIKNGSTVYELYQDDSLSPEARGKIDHIAYVSYDIEADYSFALEAGYTVTTNGIESIPSFWANGCRYFKIRSATGEEIEFSAKL